MLICRINHNPLCQNHSPQIRSWCFVKNLPYNEQLKADLATAHREAVNLCVYAEIFNETSIELLIMKAAREANAVTKVAKLDSLDAGTQAPAQETAGEAQQPPA